MGFFKACLLLALVNRMSVLAQQCPQDSVGGPSVASEVTTLEGRLIFHDGIRQWFELKLDRPRCEQTSIELWRGGDDWTPLQVLRGCRVRSTGAIDFSNTGYLSLPTHQAVDQIEQVGDCALKPPLPDYPQIQPDKSIREYQVDMDVAGDHPVIFRATSAGKDLRPWQAYASYFLTGGFILYGSCGKGYIIDKVFGTPQANPSHADEAGTSRDMATFDLDRAAASGKKHLRLGYTCVRQ